MKTPTIDEVSRLIGISPDSAKRVIEGKRQTSRKHHAALASAYGFQLADAWCVSSKGKQGQRLSRADLELSQRIADVTKVSLTHIRNVLHGEGVMSHRRHYSAVAKALGSEVANRVCCRPLQIELPKPVLAEELAKITGTSLYNARQVLAGRRKLGRRHYQTIADAYSPQLAGRLCLIESKSGPQRKRRWFSLEETELAASIAKKTGLSDSHIRNALAGHVSVRMFHHPQIASVAGSAVADQLCGVKPKQAAQIELPKQDPMFDQIAALAARVVALEAAIAKLAPVRAEIADTCAALAVVLRQSEVRHD